jgi:hypothetical protein
MTSRPFARLIACALLSTAMAAPAVAQPLAGAPEPAAYAAPAPPQQPPGPRDGRECWAQVREPARYAPPPTGPEYVWTQAPAPPGAPGPVWCLTVRPMQGAPVMIAPERMGWIRVLCADDVTPARVEHLQRGLYQQGFYRGGFDGRYDAATASAVAAFQGARHIHHRGYLSYETFEAVEAPPPRVIYLRRPTTFERGYLTWPGKSRYW